MGFLSFLKRENERLRAPLKAQSYHTTTPAEPPIQGTLPQAGNTTNNQKRPPVRKHVPRRIDNNSSRNFTANAGAANAGYASSPAVPRFTDNGLNLSLSTTPSTSRPTSSHKTPSTSWLKREAPAAGGPPLSFRKPRIKSMISTRRSFPEKPTEVREEFFFEPSPVVKPPRPQTAHARRVSVQTPAPNPGATPAFVDILDAHSEIKPANFRNRVQATGARDYGEDVADRNIALNAPDTITRVSLRRASSYQPPAPREVPLHLQRLPSSPEATRSLHHIDHGHPDSEVYPLSDHPDLPPPLPYQGSKTHSTTSLNFSPFPNRGDVSTPRGAGTPPRPSRTRKTGAPNGQGRRGDIRPRGRFPVHPSHVVSDNDSMAFTSRPATFTRGYSSDNKTPSRPKTSHSMRSANEWDFPHGGVHRGETFEFPPLEDLNAAARRQRSVSRIRSMADGEANRDRPHTARPPSRGESVASAPPLQLPGFGMRSRTTSMGERSDYRPVSRDRDTSMWANGYSVGRIDIESDVHPNMTSPAPSPHIRRGDRPRQLNIHHHYHREPESLLDYERTHTLASLKSMSTTRLDEIIEAVPRRGSSLRHSSISSITPTTSSMSSNPFARPHSRHTAQTSVDLAPPHSPAFPASPKFPASSSHSSLVSGTNYGTSYCGTTVGGREDSLHSPLTSSAPTIVKVNSFNMDDYMSSEDELDGEFYAEKQGMGRKYKTPDDESLLFSESGYGFRGSQLPGLFEAIPEMPSESPPSETSRYLRHSLSTPGPHSVLKAQDEMYGNEGVRSEEREGHEDEGMDVSSRVRALRASLYESIEDEARGVVDPKRAASIRKEAKIRARVAAWKGKGALYGEDEGHADME